jgi:hypothetical protein
LSEPQFTHGEACSVSGVAGKDLSNWTQREVIDLGTLHRSGRRLYSILDLIKLRVIGDLARSIALQPSFAAAMAENVMPRAAEIAALNDDGELKHRGYHGNVSPHYLVAWVEPDKDKFHVARVEETKLLKAIQVPHPVIVVPLDAIALTVTLKALALLDKERR